MLGEKKQLIVGQLWLGADPDSLKLLPRGDHIGELQAWDLGDRQAGLDLSVPEPALRVGAEHGRRTGVRRRHQ